MKMDKTNRYVDNVFATEDEELKSVRAAILEHGMPAISVSPSSGKLLTMLVAISGARSVLEIGALGGYSGICLARGLEGRGSLTSLELKKDYAEFARERLTEAGFGHQVTYLTGPALESLAKLQTEGARFDLFFIDADKENYANYLEGCLQLATPGALIVMDNVLAGGSVADVGGEPKRYTAYMKRFNETVARDPRLESMLIPLGDGMTVARVK